jgi:hypothetical protein
VMVATGYQIQDQYRGFRLDPSAADIAGQYLKQNVPQDELSDVVVLAESRFDGRVASFWMDVDNPLEILGAGSVYPTELLPEGTKYVLVLGSLSLDGGEAVASEEGYVLVQVAD